MGGVCGGSGIGWYCYASQGILIRPHFTVRLIVADSNSIALTFCLDPPPKALGGAGTYEFD